MPDQRGETMSVRYEYHDDVLVCARHHTPVQKDNKRIWCRECADDRQRAATIRHNRQMMKNWDKGPKRFLGKSRDQSGNH